MDRSVEVRLRLEIANFMRNASSAGREVDALTARLAALDAQVDRVEASANRAGDSLRGTRAQVRGLGRDTDRAGGQIGSAQAALDAFNASAGQGSARVDRLGRTLTSTGNEIDTFSGRVGALVDLGLILGPGLAPIGAVGVQAIGGLTAAATAAALAGGAAIVAFQGVGDAVKAVDAYQLDPTAESLEKAQAALDALGPEAATFVTEFQKVQPVLTEMRNAAAEGFFPGMIEALDDLERAAPLMEQLLTASGRAGGGIAEDLAGAIASDRWAPFLEFLTAEVEPTMASLSRTTGDLTHGLAEMFMAADPANDRFLDWTEDVAASFDSWASSDEGRKDIQAFLEYARESGPDVAELFTSLVGTLASLAKAAAPLGGPVLDGLTILSDLLGDVADSDLGTPIMAGVLAWRLYTRGAAAAASMQARYTSAVAASVAQTTRLTAANRAALGAAPAHLRGALTAPRPSDVAAARRGQALRGAGMAAGLGLAMSGAADEVGLMNTALLSMAGPAGAAAGFMLDVYLHTNEVEDAQKNLTATLSSSASTYAEVAAAQDALTAAQQRYADGLTGSPTEVAGTLASDPIEAWKLGLDALDGNLGRLEDSAGATKAMSTETELLGRNFMLLAQSMGDTTPITAADLMDPDVDRVEAIFSRLGPSLDELGISLDDLKGMSIPQIMALADDLESLNGQVFNSTNLLKGFTASLAAAEGYLSGRAGWREYEASIDAATAALKENGRTLDRNTPKGRANAAALDGIAASGLAIAETMKGAERRDFLRGLRAQLRQTASAFGANKGQIDAFLDGLNLIDVRARQVRTALNTVPKAVRTKILADGVPKTMAEVNALVREYELTERERKALIRLMNAGKTKADAQALAAVLDQAARDRQATITVTTNRVTVLETRYSGSGAGAGALGRGPQPAADGDTVPRGGPYVDQFPYLLAPGEEVVSNRRGQADAYRDVLKAISANASPDTIFGLVAPTSRRAANGGTAGRGTTGTVGRPSGGSRDVRLHLTGTLDTPWGPAQLRDLVVDTARAEYDADRRFEAAHGG